MVYHFHIWIVEVYFVDNFNILLQVLSRIDIALAPEFVVYLAPFPQMLISWYEVW